MGKTLEMEENKTQNNKNEKNDVMLEIEHVSGDTEMINRLKKIIVNFFEEQEQQEQKKKGDK